MKVSLSFISNLKKYPEGLESKWVRTTENVLCSIGRNDLWLNQNEMNYINVNIHIKQILLDHFSQQWHDKLSNSTKGKNYNSFKDDIALENYFKILPKNFRKSKYGSIPNIKS